VKPREIPCLRRQGPTKMSVHFVEANFLMRKDSSTHSMSIISMVEPQQRKLAFSDQFSYPRDIFDFLSRTRFTEYGYMYITRYLNARSYSVRSKRVWNVLPKEIGRNTMSLSSYKSLLRKYHQNALNQTYDPEDARTWKTTVCIKCGPARSLLVLPPCSF
jgi:hypothetical protein